VPHRKEGTPEIQEKGGKTLKPYFNGGKLGSTKKGNELNARGQKKGRDLPGTETM